jgi:cytochrome b561
LDVLLIDVRLTAKHRTELIAPLLTTENDIAMAGPVCSGRFLGAAMSNTVLERLPEKVPLHYDTMTIVLHWATVSLVVVLWILGQTSDWWPRGPLRDASWSLHVTLGFVLAVILLARIIWRLGPGRALPNAFVRGYTLFESVSLPQIGDKALRKPLTDWHGLAANAILVVALFHAAAGLFHQYIRKDRLLWRRWHA